MSRAAISSDYGRDLNATDSTNTVAGGDARVGQADRARRAAADIVDAKNTATMRLLYKTKSGAAATIPAEFSGMTEPELNTVLLTSLMAMVESGDITADSAPAFEAMGARIRGQLKRGPKAP